MTHRPLLAILGCWVNVAAAAEPTAPPPIPAQDSLQFEASTQAHRDVLESIAWDPAPFEVHLQRPVPDESDAEWLVRFPSPLPRQLHPAIDVVWLEWYAAAPREAASALSAAVLIIPETSRRRIAAKAVARLLRTSGVHAFVLHPPGYARRDVSGLARDPAQLVANVRQTAADARRARDAILHLEGVPIDTVHVAGVSLGGFIAPLAAALDEGFAGAFILLAGGDLEKVVSEGQRDAATFRIRLAEAGFTGERLRDLLWQVEPLRVADRLPPQRSWIYSGRFDQVVPLDSAQQLAQAVQMPPDHHVILPVDHYAGVLFLPGIAQHMAQQIQNLLSDSHAP